MSFAKANVRRERTAMPLGAAGADKSKATALEKAHAVARRGFLVFPLASVVLLAISGTIAIKVMTAMQYTPGGLSLGVLGVLGAVGVLMLLIMRVRLAPPIGLPMTKEVAPDLVELIEDIRHEMKAPKPHAVFLTKDLDVRLELRPNSGMCGSMRSELAIGLPAMQALSRLELAALLAHEFGHVSAAQGEKALFVHRMRQTWSKVLAALPRMKSPLSLPLAYFAASHTPEFFAAAQEHFRHAELAADTAAAKLVGAGSLGTALQRMSIAKAFLAEYWNRIDAESEAGATGDDHPFHEMADFMPRLAEWEQGEDVLRTALGVRTQSSSSEPALMDRLKAMGLKPRLPGALTDPAAALLGDFTQVAVETFEHEWQAARTAKAKAAAAARAPVAAARENFAEGLPRMAVLDAAAVTGPLGLAEAIERARLAESELGLEAAHDRFIDLAEWHQNESRAWLAFAEALVRDGSEEALTCIEQALTLASDTTWQASEAPAWFALGKTLLDHLREEGIACLEQAALIDAALTDEAAFLIDAFDEKIGTSSQADEDDILAGEPDSPQLQAAS